MITNGFAVANLMRHRLPFTAELKTVAGVVAGNGILDRHNAVGPVLNLVEQVKAIVDIVMGIAVFQTITFSYAHFDGKAIGVDFSRILIGIGFRVDHPVVAGPQRSANLFRG